MIERVTGDPETHEGTALSSFSFEIDPHVVLGVTAEASLEQIREAYRRKSKTYHPDVGGEEWAFRVLVQSYEILSTARVMRATRAEPTSSRGQTADATAPPRRAEPSAVTVRGESTTATCPRDGWSVSSTCACVISGMMPPTSG
jgi:hypothetical protein